MTSSPIRAAGGPLIVGIESSCDETGVGIVRGHELLANEVASSVELHVRFGGVVPEVASRAHLEAMVPTLQRACATADIDLSEIDGVAVTVGPGLDGRTGRRSRQRQGARVRAEQAALRGEPPGRPCRGRPAGARAASGALCRAAGVRRSHLAAAGDEHCRRHCSSSDRQSTTPQARRTTRSLACSACRTRAAPTSTRRRPAIPTMSVSRAG